MKVGDPRDTLFRIAKEKATQREVKRVILLIYFIAAPKCCYVLVFMVFLPWAISAGKCLKEANVCTTAELPILTGKMFYHKGASIKMAIEGSYNWLLQTLKAIRLKSRGNKLTFEHPKWKKNAFMLHSHIAAIERENFAAPM
jgi:hypothetical protein